MNVFWTRLAGGKYLGKVKIRKTSQALEFLHSYSLGIIIHDSPPFVNFYHSIPLSYLPSTASHRHQGLTIEFANNPVHMFFFDV